MADETIDAGLEALANRAADHLEEHVHRNVLEVLIHFNLEDRLAIFEMQTESVRLKSGDKVRRWWIISGKKIPTTFVPKIKTPGPRTVLERYTEDIGKWAEAVAAGQEPPFKVHIDVEVTPKRAAKIGDLCVQIREKVLPKLKDQSPEKAE